MCQLDSTHDLCGLLVIYEKGEAMLCIDVIDYNVYICIANKKNERKLKTNL